VFSLCASRARVPRDSCLTECEQVAGGQAGNGDVSLDDDALLAAGCMMILVPIARAAQGRFSPNDQLSAAVAICNINRFAAAAEGGS